MNEFQLQRDVSLAALTTLEVGGPARALVTARSTEALVQSLELAREREWAVAVVGSGSNLLASDRGFDGMLVQYAASEIEGNVDQGAIRVGAGHDWDELVAWAVGRGFSGLECLSGIPGRVGAAPIQNVGAYGREVAEVLTAVHAVDLQSGQAKRLSAQACDFGYRDSRFKRDWRNRWCVTAVELQLEPGGRPTPAYAELARRLAEYGEHPPLDQVRAAVLEIRRGKSMVLDPEDPNRRSAGSFFTNPILDVVAADEVQERARRQDPGAPDLPRWSADTNRVKIPAAWLIERSGLHKGYTQGRAGLSERHVLALVNRGGATADELLALARTVRDRVLDRFGVRLVPEPVALGFAPGEVDDLWPVVGP